jgi:hypothetical protein
VIANVCYDHNAIRMAVQMALQLPAFSQDEKLKKRKFTRPWIKGFIRRQAMRKRRITTQVKKLPSPEEVQYRRLTEL